MCVGIAADHGGFEFKAPLTAALKAAGYEVAGFGAHEAKWAICKEVPRK